MTRGRPLSGCKIRVEETSIAIRASSIAIEVPAAWIIAIAPSRWQLSAATIMLREAPAMLHHISLGVSDIELAAAFYDAILAPLGYVRVWDDLRPGETGQAVGYGPAGGGDKLALKHQPEGSRPPGPGFHLAFAAPDEAAVQRFHLAALAQGGTDNGAPGLRAHYGPHYYAAFVIDPDGHRLEAVFNASPKHSPEG